MHVRILFLIVAFSSSCLAQQMADSLYHPEIAHPLFETGKGPLVLIDEAHYNFHTRDGRYAPFTAILESDGLVVKSNTSAFSAKALSGCGLLVIANALNEKNSVSWSLPTPSAFTKREIRELKKWVSQGGSLFLIADHMPFAGAATELAAAFGFACYNGYATKDDKQPDVFTWENKRLVRDSLFGDSVRTVRTFTGQGFDCPEAAHPFLVLDTAFTMYFPAVSGQFKTDCTIQNAGGMVQGAYLAYGKGRLVISGEAAMFSAQLANGKPMGMNAPEATDNLTLLRVLIRWLTADPTHS